MRLIPAHGLAAALAGLGPAAAVLVDFDHTLFAANSTELFVATCRPAALVAPVDALVSHLVPWRRLYGPQSFRARDRARCLALIVLFPWSLALWRRRCAGLMGRHASREVGDALADIDPARTVVVTFGLAPVVRPLLAHSRWRDSRLLATPLLAGRAPLRQGKRALAEAALGPRAVAACGFVSDSLDDADLLEAAARGLLVEPQGEPVRAGERLYLPLRYAARAKYAPGYVLDQIVLVDLALLVLAGFGTAEAFAWRALAAGFLLVSLVCVYEVGYFDNDMVASAGEAAPTLGPRTGRYRGYPIRPAAWLWALAAGAAGLGLGWAGGVLSVPWPSAALAWAGALAVLHLLFLAYNRAPVGRRVVLYPALQLMKYLPVLALLGSSALGAALVACQVATMWGGYLVYRLGGDKAGFRREAVRTVLFAATACLLLTALPLSILGGWASLGVSLAWSAARLAKVEAMARLRGRTRVPVAS